VYDGNECVLAFRRGCFVKDFDEKCSCPTLMSSGMASGTAELDPSRGFVCRWKSDLLKTADDLSYLLRYWKSFNLPIEYPRRWILNFAERLKISSEAQFAALVAATKSVAPGGAYEDQTLFESCRHLLRKAGSDYCFTLFRHNPSTTLNLPGDSDMGSTVLYGTRFLTSPSCRYMREIMDSDGVYFSQTPGETAKSRDMWETMYSDYCTSTSTFVSNPSPDFPTDLSVVPSMTYECDCHSRNVPIPNTLLQEIGWVDKDVMISDFMTRNRNRPEADLLSRHVRRREYDIFSSSRQTAEDQDACWFRACKDPQRFTRKDRTDSRIACPSVPCLISFNISNVRGNVNITENNFDLKCGGQLVECVLENTASRSIKDGRCVCKSGFEGMRCEKETGTSPPTPGSTPAPGPAPSPSPGPGPDPRPRPTPSSDPTQDPDPAPDPEPPTSKDIENIVQKYWWVGVAFLCLFLLLFFLLIKSKSSQKSPESSHPPIPESITPQQPLNE
jgi:hypothetical protein